MDYESFLELVKKRRSYWEFKSDPVPDDYVEKIVDTARYAPSGFNSQPWEFVVIKEQELRDGIVGLIADNMRPPGMKPGGPPPPQPKPGMKDPMGFKTAPVFILVCGDTRVRNFGPPGLQNNDKRFMEILISSLAIPFQYMHLAATSLGLTAKWVSATAMPKVESKLKEFLGIPEEFVVYDMMALGYSDFQPHPKKMRELSEVLHFGKCGKEDFRTEEEVKAFFNRG
ncbi:MAG: nitroreductase family protein [Deltaproteobacteria bacterium]|nr:nitroreductase family protein [Deltaproteobacteria bacterium]